MVVANVLLRNTERAVSQYFPDWIDPVGVVLQLASSDPVQLREAAELALQRHSFAEVNLNAGCPASSASVS